MKQTRLLSTLIVLLFAVTGLSAQETVVSGTVTGANTGDPLPGANITITNTNYGGATDINGNYSFQVPASGETVELEVRFIGYYSTTSNIA